jgi:hypothetical protein
VDGSSIVSLDDRDATRESPCCELTFIW